MAKIIVALIVLFAVSFSNISPTIAASSSVKKDLYSTAGTYSLTLNAGALHYTGTGSQIFAPLYGVKVGYDAPGKYIFDSFGTEGSLNYFSSNSSKRSGSTTGYLFRIDEVLPFTPGERLVPFAAVGAGGIYTSSDTSTKVLPFFNYGAGLKYFLGSNLALRADVRHILALTINGIDNFELSAGLSYYFGKESGKKPEPVPEARKTDEEQKPNGKNGKEQREKELKEKEQKEQERRENERAEQELRAQERRKQEKLDKERLHKEWKEFAKTPYDKSANVEEPTEAVSPFSVTGNAIPAPVTAKAIVPPTAEEKAPAQVATPDLTPAPLTPPITVEAVPPAGAQAIPAHVTAEAIVPPTAEEKAPAQVATPDLTPAPLTPPITVEAVPPAGAQAIPAPVTAEAIVPPTAAEKAPAQVATPDLTPAPLTPPITVEAVPPARAQEKATADAYYTLSTSETVNRKKVESLVNMLKSVGQQPFIVKETKDTEIYRLVTDCTNDNKEAVKRKEQLSSLVRDAFIIRNGDTECVVVGSFLTEKEAIQEQKRLAKKGLSAHVDKVRGSRPFWHISSGRYADLRQATEEALTLAGFGITTNPELIGHGLAEPVKQNVVSELTLEFEFNRSYIDPKYYRQLREIADFLKSTPSSSVLIEGHTDSIGRDSYNFRLSMQRAKSVKNSLIKFGITRDKIFTRGFGPTRPIADNSTSEGRQKNRRAVTIVIVKN